MAYRDMSVPYTEEEIEGLREIFQSMPTYKDDRVLASDIPNLITAMRFERTPEQVQAYMKYWEEQCDGKIEIEEFVASASAIHKTSLYAREYAIKAGKDKDGFISADDFTSILELISTHDPSLSTKPYEDFVAEADTNQDGKVSIDECMRWIEKYTDK